MAGFSCGSDTSRALRTEGGLVRRAGLVASGIGIRDLFLALLQFPAWRFEGIQPSCFAYRILRRVLNAFQSHQVELSRVPLQTASAINPGSPILENVASGCAAGWSASPDLEHRFAVDSDE